MEFDIFMNSSLINAQQHMFLWKMFRSKKTIEISHLDGVHQSTLAIKKRYLLKAISVSFRLRLEPEK